MRFKDIYGRQDADLVKEIAARVYYGLLSSTV